MHINEEARARFLSRYFNRIVALFSGLLFNTPGEMLEGKLATRGRIEYQFKNYGGTMAAIFIEVKLDVSNLAERLNCYAQVIAECDGEFRMTLVKDTWLTVFAACAWMNFQNGHHVPIMAILCYGSHFYFFKFEDRQQAGGAPQFFLGKFQNGSRRQLIAEIENPDDPDDARDFLRKARLLCESLYYVFLSGYRTGLEGLLEP